MDEPMLVSFMRRNPTGEIRFIPQDNPIMGTSTAGFLAELDAYIDAKCDEYLDNM